MTIETTLSNKYCILKSLSLSLQGLPTLLGFSEYVPEFESDFPIDLKSFRFLLDLL